MFECLQTSHSRNSRGRTTLLLSAGVLGFLLLLTAPLLVDAWKLNVTSIQLDRALKLAQKTGALSSSQREQLLAACEQLALDAHVSEHFRTAIWRTYAVAASLAPSERAYSLLERARMAGDLDRTASLYAAEVALALKHWNTAREIYQQVDVSNALLGRAEKYLEQGSKSEALELFRLAAESLFAQIEREKARRLLEERVGAHSRQGISSSSVAERITVLYRIGRGLLSCQQPEEALPVLEQAYSMAQLDSPGRVVQQSIGFALAQTKVALLSSDLSHAEANTYLGNPSYYWPTKHYAQAVKPLIEIRALVYKSLSVEETAAAKTQAATLLYRIGDEKPAIALLREALNVDNRNIRAYLLLGEIFEKRGMRIQARELYGRGIASVGNNPQLYRAYALTVFQTMTPEDALPVLEKAENIGAADAYVYLALGDTYKSLGMLDQARVAYKKGLMSRPTLASLLARLKTLPSSRLIRKVPVD